MTDRDFEGRLRAGLRQMADEGASPALRASVIDIPDAVAPTPERRVTARWGFPAMSRFAPIAIAATAVAVAILMGVSLILRSPNVGPPPVPGPTSSAVPQSTLPGPTHAPGTSQNPALAWGPTGSMVAPRYDHTATLLPNGSVLVAGGFDGNNALASAELYDPIAGTWTPTGSLLTPRSGHTATLLPTGRVLVTGGGNSNGDLASAELYDPDTGTWATTGSMAVTRELHTATLLTDGLVLVAGGLGDGREPAASAELYDPATGSWTLTGSMGTPRYAHAATRLLDGSVLAIGGADHGDASCCYLANAELYDPGTGSWTAVGGMGDIHGNNAATLLRDGRVLLDGPLHELYDPATGTWTATGGTLTSCCRLTLLADGRVLVLGVGVRDQNDFTKTSAKLYDPVADSWTAAGKLATQRYAYTATLLLDGRVLVAGGWSEPAPSNTAPSALTSAELFGPGR